MEWSRARLASTVTVLPSAPSKSALLMSLVLKKLGGGPSTDHVSACPLSFFDYTKNWICGFRQSTFVKVPVKVTRSFKLKRAVIL